MNEDAYNTIMALFKSGEMESIKFTKKGKIIVKWKREGIVIQYTGINSMNQVLKDLEMFEETI